MKRGFRFQNGEYKDIANEIRSGSIPQVDVDNDDEYNGLIEDLKGEGMFLSGEQPDVEAIDKVENMEFQYRLKFFIDNDKSKIGYADFYTVELPEETYADAFGD